MRPVAVAGVATLLVSAGCACPCTASRGEDAMEGRPTAARPRLVRTLAEVRAALGQRVRVQGTAAREKLGDSVDVGGLVLICLDHRFPDDRIGRTVLVEGVLDETRDFQAVRGPHGEVSQGTESEAALLVLRACVERGGSE